MILTLGTHSCIATSGKVARVPPQECRGCAQQSQINECLWARTKGSRYSVSNKREKIRSCKLV